MVSSGWLFISAQAVGSFLHCENVSRGISRMKKALIVAVNICIIIKLRLREGEPLDAKIYLQAGAQP